MVKRFKKWMSEKVSDRAIYITAAIMIAIVLAFGAGAIVYQSYERGKCEAKGGKLISLTCVRLDAIIE